MKNPIKTITDGFKNIIKGLGSSKDPRQANYFVKGLKINQQLANDIYVYNWLAAKIVDVPIDDATRKWRTLLISDPDEKKTIQDLMKDWDVKTKTNLAAKWARVFGGSVIIAIIDGQDQADPLDIESIKQDSLSNFIVLDRYNIEPLVINREILSENFGKPEFYTVNRSGQKIHYTRLIKFDGVTGTIRELEENNFWGNSIFTKLWEPVSDSQIVSNSINNLIFEANVDVYRINGLNSMVAEGNDDLVVKRLKLAHEMKSVINGIALDKEDEYDKKSNQFANLDSIDQEFKQTVSGSADIPVTRLWGKSPAGMNATGESDMLNYYDNVQSIQENVLRPKIDWLDSIILASAGIKNTLEYEFKPLKQLTEVEQATVSHQNAQRDQIYLDAAIIEDSDVVAQLAEDGTYVSIDENRVEEAKKDEESGFDV